MTDQEVPRTKVLLFGALAAPVAWVVQFSIHYGLTPAMCGGMGRTVPLLVAVGAVAVALAALVVSASAWRALDIGDDLGDRIDQRSRSLALAGILASTFFVIVIVATAMPALLLDPCLR